MAWPKGRRCYPETISKLKRYRPSPETREKLRVAGLGRKPRPETLLKLSHSAKKSRVERGNYWLVGKKHPFSTILKMRVKRKHYWDKILDPAEDQTIMTIRSTEGGGKKFSSGTTTPAKFVKRKAGSCKLTISDHGPSSPPSGTK